MKMHSLWIDIGAKNKKDAEKSVAIGDPATINVGYIELKNVRMWAPNAKKTDADEFRHFGTEILLHDTPIEEESIQYQRALSLERIGNTVCDIMQDSGDISTKKKTSGKTGNWKTFRFR